MAGGTVDESSLDRWLLVGHDEALDQVPERGEAVRDAGSRRVLAHARRPPRR